MVGLGGMKTGRFKVSAHLVEWFEEFRRYHRKDGLIVKTFDDLMSATRIAVMDHRHARPEPFDPRTGRAISGSASTTLRTSTCSRGSPSTRLRRRASICSLGIRGDD